MKKRFSLNSQLFLTLLLVFVIPIICMGSYLYITVTADLKQVNREDAIHSSQAAKSLIDSYGKNLLNVETSNSHWSDYRNAVENKDTTWIDDNINSLQSSVKNLNFIATTDVSGNVLSQVGDNSSFRTHLPQEVMDRLKTESDFYGVLNTEKGLAIVSVSKVTDETGKESPTGVLIFGRYIDRALLLELKNTLQSDIALLPDTGSMLSTTQTIQQSNLKQKLHAALSNTGYEEFVSAKIAQTKVSEVFSTLPGIAKKPVAEIYVQIPTAANTKIENDITKLSILVITITVLMLLVISYLLRIRLIHPIHQLSVVIEQVAEGHLRSNLHTTYMNRSDEVGMISSSLNKMMQNLNQIVGDLHSMADQLAASSDQFHVQTEQTSLTTKQITVSIQGVAEGAESQSRSVEEAVNTVHRMSESVDQSVANARAVADTANITSIITNNGLSSVEKAVDQMNLIHQSVDNAATKLQDLNEQAQYIGKIVEVITSISSQTNLLALNAAIEAARAGEHGRGFSVVADEVRKLAEESARSANQINDYITNIQTTIQHVIDSMNEGTTEVRKGIDVVHTAGQSFSEIQASVEQVTAKVRDVTMTMKNMLHNTGEVMDSFTVIADAAEQAVSGTQTVSAATQEQLAAMEEIAVSAHSLAKMADGIRVLVAHFDM